MSRIELTTLFTHASTASSIGAIGSARPFPGSAHPGGTLALENATLNLTSAFAMHAESTPTLFVTAFDQQPSLAACFFAAAFCLRLAHLASGGVTARPS